MKYEVIIQSCMKNGNMVVKRFPCKNMSSGLVRLRNTGRITKMACAVSNEVQVGVLKPNNDELYAVAVIAPEVKNHRIEQLMYRDEVGAVTESIEA